MKRTVVILSLIFALAIAVSVTIPALAATGTTTITGTVTGKIDLTAPTTFSLGLTMQPGTTYNGSDANGSVRCNQAWQVVASNTSGHMVGPTMNLTDKLSIQLTGGTTVGSWANASTGSTTSSAVKSTGGDSGQTLTLNAGQLIHYADEPGAYNIVITLLGSLN